MTCLVVALAMAGCADDMSREPAPTSDAALRHVELEVSAAGLPPFPGADGTERERAELREAQAAERERLDAAGRRVVRALAELGAGSPKLMSGPSGAYVRARLDAEQVGAAERLREVRAVRPALVLEGRLERYDVGWVLVAPDGSRYALNWASPRPAHLKADARLAVEAVREDGPTLFFAPGATPLLVRDARPA